MESASFPRYLRGTVRTPLLWFSEFHHQLHTLLFSLVVVGTALIFCDARVRTSLFVLASFHLHLFCDLIGARGPDGYSWPIPYLAPFTQAHAWQWSAQWPLNGWENFVITGVLLVATIAMAVHRGHTVVELFSRRADQSVVSALRRRFRSA